MSAAVAPAPAPELEGGVLRARTVLRLAVSAAWQQLSMVWPLALAELFALVLGLVPGLVLVTQVIVQAQSMTHAGPLALAFGFLAVITDPATHALMLVGTLLATFGAFLLRSFVHAWAAKALAPQLGVETPVDATHSLASLLVDPGRWLAAAGLAAVLRTIAVVSALGAVTAGMVFFVNVPGIAAALGMTLVTAAMICIPLLDAALDLGVVRAVLGDEGPVTALGEGLLLAVARARALLRVWWLGVMADIGIGIGLGSGTAILSQAPSDDGFWILMFGPRALLYVVAAFATAGVALVRIAAYAAIVQDAAEALPVVEAEEAPPEPVPAVVVEAVVEAVVVEAVHEAVAVDEPVLEAVAVEPVHEAVAVEPAVEEPAPSAPEVPETPGNEPDPKA